MSEAITDEDFANLLTDAGEEQPETDSEAPEEVAEQEDTQAEAEDEAEGPEAEAEETEEQPQEADSAGEFLEAEINGEKVKISKDEALQAYRDRESMRADYTRKTQAIAQERQQLQQQQQQDAQFQAAFADDLGQLYGIQAQLRQYEQADWNAAFDADPVQASKAQAEFIRLQHAAQRLSGSIQQKHQGMIARAKAEEQQAFSAVWQHMQAKDPAFNRDRLAGMVRAANERYGVNPELLLNIRQPELLEMWNDLTKKAEAYERLQSSKPKAKAAVAASKVTKPAAPKPNKATAQGKAIKKLSARSGTDDFAAALGASR